MIIPEIDTRSASMGFSTNRSGGHMSRSMMFDEMSALCKTLDPGTTPDGYKKAIIDDNILGKPTFSSRQNTFRHLVELYTLDPAFVLFRVFRKFADLDLSSLPLLTMICTFCRDPQLRHSYLLIDRLKYGEVLKRERMEEHLESGFPGRFSDAMKRSLAQNVNTTWTIAGHLSGRSVKKKTTPEPRPIATMYSMFAGFLTGLRGETLINSVFASIAGHQDCTLLQSHLASGNGRGWLRFRSAGGVVELDFTPLLNEQDRELLHGKN